MATLMIVDDDRELAQALAAVLGENGYKVEIQLSVEEALAAMSERKPDLVLLDVMFPEDLTAGFSLARKMKHYKEEFKDVPVLMMTAINEHSPLHFTSNDIDEQWLPVSDFMNKPLDFDILLEKVAGLLEVGKT